jgi:transposase-like protein
MARPSKLSPTQWQEIERRLAEGETPSTLAREFGVHPSQITRRVSQVSQKVREVAQKVANAQTALAELPAQQQYAAMSLADKLRNISTSLASAAEHGAATAHRLNALANSEVSKVDDAAPLSEESITALKGVGVLTKLANDSASIALNLLAANKDAVKQIATPEPEPESLPPLRPQLSREEWLKAHGLN